MSMSKEVLLSKKFDSRRSLKFQRALGLALLLFSLVSLKAGLLGWRLQGKALQGYLQVPAQPFFPSNFSTSFARVVLGCWETNWGWREDRGGTGWRVPVSVVLELSTGCGPSCTSGCKTGIRDM